MPRRPFRPASETFSRTVLALALSAAALAAQPANTILFERWDGITGTAVSNLTSNAAYPDNPTTRSYPTLYELPSNAADNYGTRTRGYVTPPTTGNYTFWIAGDDNAELWLGTSSDPATARLIANVPGYTNSREWTKYSQQQSASIALTAGTRYYIETRHKDGTGGDNLAVGWQGPGITGDAERPIPGTRLSPFVLTSPVAKTILMERWDGISGTTVSSLTSNANYPNNPTARSYPTLYEIPSGIGDNYGTRTRGYVTPPTTGNYTFWIASDDNSELWLGTSSDPATARQIASVPDWTNAREWTKFSQQQSASIALTAGTRYYIETRHKENTGGDNLAVGWQGPGITGDAERPIPGSRLAPFIFGAAPAITAQPANLAVNEGQAATFSVTATGTAPLAYQWRKNGADISGAASASYTTPAATPADNGAQFSVVVSNSQGAVTSGNAVLTVIVAPVITTQPAGQTVNVGQTATFAVAATGTAPLAYQWRKNGADISGATLPTYTTPAAIASDNGAQFSVVVSNAAGAAASVNAVLTVNAPPAISTQPSNLTVSVGQVGIFSVIATGTAPLAYQWRKNGADIGGANSSSYTTPPAAAADNGAVFSVVVSNPVGTITSVNAVFTVITPPSITAQPSNQTVNAAQTATFSVTATGSSPLAYQWRKNGANIPGATGASYTTPPTIPSDNGAAFSVIVSNAGGTVISGNAFLTVISIATNSRKIAVSGELVDASGNPVGYPAPVTVDAIVKLYNDASAGNLLYTEEFRAAAGKGIAVTNGLFVARLGEGTTTQVLQLVLSGNANLWAEVTIDDGTPDVLLPRTPVTASPYTLGAIPTQTAPISGAGDPNAANVPGEVGIFYVNTSDNTTWLKLKTGWKRMD